MSDIQKKFEEIKRQAENEYKEIGSVFCPFLNKKINFNAKGLKHIKFKKWDKSRSRDEQYLRLKFLRFVPRILERANTLQEYNETKVFEMLKRNSRWEKILTPVKFYGFVAIWNYQIKIKIIVKEIESGHPFFWSVMPFWKTKGDPILNETKKVFHEGDLEND